MIYTVPPPIAQLCYDASAVRESQPCGLFPKFTRRQRNVYYQKVTSYTLLVPDLFFPEIGKILWKRVRRGEDTADDARQTFAEFSAVSMQVYESRSLIPTALDIALQSDRTVYDSL